MIPAQKYSVVYGRGIACDRGDQVAAVRASRNLDSVGESYIGDDFPQNGLGLRGAPPPFWNCTKKSIDLTRLKRQLLSLVL
jgi:hypothetical protein